MFRETKLSTQSCLELVAWSFTVNLFKQIPSQTGDFQDRQFKVELSLQELEIRPHQVLLETLNYGVVDEVEGNSCTLFQNNFLMKI